MLCEGVIWSFPTETCWSSLTPSLLLKHILVFKNALAFMLKNGLVKSSNAEVKNLLKILQMLYEVSASFFGQVSVLGDFFSVCQGWGHTGLYHYYHY